MKRWSKSFRAAPVTSDGVWLALFALTLRLCVVAWAWQRFPPADDGIFYHQVAERIAHGLGYTWLWPDGAVTYAAHYPIGYPGLMGFGYALLGSHPEVAMLENASLGALGVFAVHRLAAHVGQRGPALLAGLVAAVHPSVLFYTPALMTEGVTAAAFAVLAWLALAAQKGGKVRLSVLGLVAGATVLVRPQALLLVPILGLLASVGPALGRLRSAAWVTALAVLVCLPWTIRNCYRLEHCAFVSANGGWNLFIGSAEKATGTWVSIDELGVPAECRTVFGEVEKDQCFGRAGLRNVLSRPLHFLALVPSKLAATFDWSGAPGHYLHASNPAAFPEGAKVTLGVIEQLVQRGVLSVGLLALGLSEGPRRRLRLLLGAIALSCLWGPAFFARWWLLRSAWVGHLLLVFQAICSGPALLRRPNFAFAAAAVGTTALTHALFFGAGRYGLVCVLLVVPLLAEVFRRDATPSEAAS